MIAKRDEERKNRDREIERQREIERHREKERMIETENKRDVGKEKKRPWTDTEVL